MARPSNVLSGVRQALRPLAAAVATPLLPADFLDVVAPMRPGSGRARVLCVQPETARATTVVLRPAGRWPGHRAGQFVRLGIEVDGVRLWRSYSLTGPASSTGTLSVTVNAVPDGVVSGFVVGGGLRPGAVVGLEGPDGEFTLPATTPPARTLFVTAGSGITPVMGMLRTHLDDLADVVVVHSARTPQDVVFGPQLRLLHARGRIRLVERHTATDGRLTADDLVRLVPDLADRPTWACGPNALVDTVGELFTANGWELATERFRPVVAVLGDGGPVTFTRAGRTVEADGATAILDAGEDAGVLLPSGCRMGVCYGCVVPLVSGAVRDRRNGALTAAGESGEHVLVQTCINTAAGPCTLDA